MSSGAKDPLSLLHLINVAEEHPASQSLLYVKQHTPRTARCTNDPETESEIVLVAKIMRMVVEIAAYRQFNPGNTMGATIVF
ncbi:hypothetical protein BofuT4_uP084450.1 [Botrytis cinerea T4]|uniref:Uncharacterized protein n=1 Tax=Botryotinia fuckeliana (strain T4) TaxID=999810 RepID=G2YJK4_BOTF4|nr:hypothetical protein BofuT4_uP084450.1 [Botrytis cinerea T4]